MSNGKKTYTVMKADEHKNSWLQGKMYKLGDLIELTDAEAKYGALNGQIKIGKHDPEADEDDRQLKSGGRKSNKAPVQKDPAKSENDKDGDNGFGGSNS